MKNPMVILVGPSGAGKSSFVKKIVDDMPGFVDTVTYTTRDMRNGESEGDPYHFVSEPRFRELIEKNFFIEWAQVHECLYGTPRHQIEDAWHQGRQVIMDVDVQGARTFKQHYPHAFAIFLVPPSIDVLRQRVMKRDGRSPRDLELRMQNALKEMDQAKDFDARLVNDDFATSYGQLKKMIEDYLDSE